MEKRISDLETDVHAYKYISVALAAFTLANFGISLWYLQQKTEPDWDFIAVTLTIFELLIAILLVGGYWLFRQHVEKAATDEANEIATEVASRVAGETVLQHLRTLQPAFTSNGGNASMQEMMDALDETNTTGGDNG